MAKLVQPGNQEKRKLSQHATSSALCDLFLTYCTLFVGSIEGFHVTSYQANFASYPSRDRHVGFLLHGRV